MEMEVTKGTQPDLRDKTYTYTLQKADYNMQLLCGKS